MLPDADVKIYLTANPTERAKRRMNEDGEGDLEHVVRQLKIRDDGDKSRSVGPLVVPKGAVVVDSTGKTSDQVAELVIRLIEKKWIGNEVPRK